MTKSTRPIPITPSGTQHNVTSRTAKESFVSSTRLIMPNETNFLSFLMGGNLMSWMDTLAATCAMKHSNTKAVTVSVDNLTFKKSIHLGAVARMEGYVTRVFNSSMEVYIKVFEDVHIPVFSSEMTNEAYYTFVAVNDLGKPIPVRPIIPETEEEKIQYTMALKRRQIRLFLSKKITLSQEEIITLFSHSS